MPAYHATVPCHATPYSTITYHTIHFIHCTIGLNIFQSYILLNTSCITLILDALQALHSLLHAFTYPQSSIYDTYRRYCSGHLGFTMHCHLCSAWFWVVVLMGFTMGFIMLNPPFNASVYLIISSLFVVAWEHVWWVWLTKNMWRYSRYNLSRTVLPSHIAEIMTISTDYIPRLNERSVAVGSHRYHIIRYTVHIEIYPGYYSMTSHFDQLYCCNNQNGIAAVMPCGVDQVQGW